MMTLLFTIMINDQKGKRFQLLSIIHFPTTVHYSYLEIFPKSIQTVDNLDRTVLEMKSKFRPNCLQKRKEFNK